MSDYCAMDVKCKKLIDASIKNCVVCAVEFIKNKCNVNEAEGRCYSRYPLIEAVFHSDGVILDLLLKCENINLEVILHGITPLGYACGEASLDNIRKLLERGAKINGSSIYECSPVNVAVASGRGNSLKFLLGFDTCSQPTKSIPLYIEYECLLRSAKHILDEKEDKDAITCYEVLLEYGSK